MAMATRIQKTDFDFRSLRYGYYLVTYTSPATGKQWTTAVTDMTLIDATKNADEPKVRDLEYLKSVCKSQGIMRNV